MATQRSRIIDAVVTALDGAGKPAGLSVVRRTAASVEQSDTPRCMVSRVRETVARANPNSRRSPVVVRHLSVRLDLWVTDSDPEEALEPLLAWATAAMQATPSWGVLAIETTEDQTEWDIDEMDASVGHAAMDFTISFPTKTADQEQKQ